MLCTYIFKKGKNKDKSCLKNNCKLHNKELKVNKKNSIIKNNNQSFDYLPVELLHEILKYINDPKILITISQTCKIFYNITEQYLERLLINSDKATIFNSNHRQISSYVKSQLLFESGCMRCHIPNIRKIHMPFAYRFCKDCIKEVTISSYRLTEAGIPEYIYRKLLCSEVTLWNSQYGTYSFYVYLRKDVELVIGCKIYDYCKIETDKIVSQIILEYPDFYESEANIKCQIKTSELSSKAPYTMYKDRVNEYIKQYRGNKYFLQFYTKNEIKQSLVIQNAIENEDYNVKKEDIENENNQNKLNDFWKSCDKHCLKDKYKNLVYTFKDIKIVNKEFQQDIYYVKEIEKFDEKYHEPLEYCKTIIRFKRKVDELKEKILLKIQKEIVENEIIRKYKRKKRNIEIEIERKKGEIIEKQLENEKREKRRKERKIINKLILDKSKNYVCDICINNTRRFCAQGLYRHKKDAHGV